MVADDLFASGFYENVNRGGWIENILIFILGVLPEKYALRASPFGSECLSCLKDFRRVGEKAAVP
ncbi:MAG: hypothetical protein ACYTX0_53520, partial [Nostoc sp.]